MFFIEVVFCKQILLKYFSVFLYRKLHFHQHFHYLYSHAVKLLSLIRIIAFSVSSLSRFLMLYIIVMREKWPVTAAKRSKA
jgi:hypothetical protein